MSCYRREKEALETLKKAEKMSSEMGMDYYEKVSITEISFSEMGLSHISVVKNLE